MSFSSASFIIEKPYTVIVELSPLAFGAEGRQELHTSAEESARAIDRTKVFIMFVLLELDPPPGADNIQIAGPRNSVVLPHVIQVDGNLLRQGPINADGKSISRETFQQRVVKDLFGHVKL